MARAAADTDDPATDVGSWSPKASSEGGITQAVQNAIDAQAAINFGDDYKGTWKPGVYAVGNVVYYSGTFYDCDVARAAADTDTPTVDAASWSVKTVNFEIGGDVNVDLSAVTAAIQNVIDAQGTASFGAAYQGTWAAGIYAVGDVVYQAGAFYTCDVARVATDTDDPATDAAMLVHRGVRIGGLGCRYPGRDRRAGSHQFRRQVPGSVGARRVRSRGHSFLRQKVLRVLELPVRRPTRMTLRLTPRAGLRKPRWTARSASPTPFKTPSTPRAGDGQFWRQIQGFMGRRGLRGR